MIVEEVVKALTLTLTLTLISLTTLQVVLTSLLLCFGAGVLLATALLHILPEVKLHLT